MTLMAIKKSELEALVASLMDHASADVTAHLRRWGQPREQSTQATIWPADTALVNSDAATWLTADFAT